MDSRYLKYIDNLNHNNLCIRLENLRKLKEAVDTGAIECPIKGNDVNNHIHTSYSFSPYSPSKSIWMAYDAGLATAGIVDHDSISGAKEFIEAGKIIGMETTVGLECRVDFSNTPLKGRRLNNPDQKSIGYITIHGVPHTKIDDVNDFIAPYRDKRNKRNIKMIDRINEIIKINELIISFENDIVPISMHNDGGSITERHILYGLSLKLIERFGRGVLLVGFLKNELKLNLSSKVESYLLDLDNPFYNYDLLGALKSDMVPMFYIDADEECPKASEVVNFCREIGAISAYAYLGDVTDSVTGDKKSQKFEDDYLELLFETLKDLGFNGISYMPSRNTIEQLIKVKKLCESYGFMQISGEDINSPRQSFICTAARNTEFKNLIDSTWALIGHEKSATIDIKDGMFSKDTINKYPDLNERIKIFRGIGLK